MKAKDVLALLGIARETLSRLVSIGTIKARKLDNGRYIYDKESVYKYLGTNIDKHNIIYGRVSTSKQKKDLENQIQNLTNYCMNNGIQIHNIYKDISSGINFDKRKSLLLLADEVMKGNVATIYITYKDRLSRIGFSLFENLFKKFGTKIVVINESNNIDEKEIINEIITLIHCFSMKHYSKRKISQLKELLLND